MEANAAEISANADNIAAETARASDAEDGLQSAVCNSPPPPHPTLTDDTLIIYGPRETSVTIICSICRIRDLRDGLKFIDITIVIYKISSCHSIFFSDVTISPVIC